MPALTQRVVIKRRLKAVFEDLVPADVVVLYAWSDREANGVRKLVVLGETTGRQEITTQRAGRKRRDDTFKQNVWVRSWVPQATPEEAEADLELIWGPLEKGLADPAIAGPNLYGNGTYSALEGSVVCTVADVDGPNALADDLGWTAECRFTVDVTVRLD